MKLRPTTDDNLTSPLGLLAGWGKLPLRVAQGMRQTDRAVVGVGIRDHADPALAELCDSFQWIGLGSLGTAIRFMRRHGVQQAVMAGKIHKVQLTQPGWWWRHRPDLTCLRAFSAHLFTGKKDGKDDTLMLTLIEAFAAAGIAFQPPTDFAPELLVQEGLIAGHSISPKQQRDLAFGWNMAKAMGGLDVGQTVCVLKQAVLAVEAIEGTDLCIRRAGELCGGAAFTVVKVAKPDQDMRFDVPTVGIRTLETIASAGGTLLAIECDRTILLDTEEFRKAAKRLRISVVACNVNASQAAA